MRSSIALITALLVLGAQSASAQQICTSDLDASGSIDQPGESQACNLDGTGTTYMCPIAESACVDPAGTGAYACPSDPSRACVANASGVQMCSLHDCADASSIPRTTLDPTIGTEPAPGTLVPGVGCSGTVEIFTGSAVRCRMAGTQTMFHNCCRDGDSKTLSDTMGASGESSNQSQYIGYIATAARIAYAGAAAGTGTAAATSYLAVAFDPVTLSIAAAMIVINIMLADQCDDEDIKTAQLKNSRFCVEVGSYCAERWPLAGCVQRSRMHCCFNSLLARIIHEQGRPQLRTIGTFGTPEAPNCRGFSPREFQALDFSKIDLSEYTSELRYRTMTEMERAMRPTIDTKLPP